MNLTNIAKGDILANYPAMCRILEVATKKGTPRDRQIVDWKRYFDFEKEGHKFKILEIYSEPKIKYDGRRNGNNRKYTSMVAVLLFDHFNRKIDYNFPPEYTLQLYRKQIAVITGICKKCFFDDDYINKLKESCNIDEKNIDEFIFYIDEKIKDIIESVTNAISRRFTYVMMEKFIEIKDSNNKIRNATNEEEKIILETEKGIRNTNYSISTNRVMGKIFFSKVNKELSRIYEWKACYRRYRISAYCFIVLGKEVKLNENETLILKQKVNNLILKAINQHYIKRCYNLEAEKRQNFLNENMQLARLLINLDY